MPGLDTRSGQRNVARPQRVGRQQFATDYIPKLKADDQNRRIAGNGQWQQGYLRQEKAPQATNPYGDIIQMGSNQSQGLISQFMQRRDQQAQQQVAQQQAGYQSSPSIDFGGQTVNAADYGRPNLETISDGDGSAALLRSGSNAPVQTQSRRPDGIVQKPGGGGYINYGVANYGTRAVYNPQTRKAEIRSINPDGTTGGISTTPGRSTPNYQQTYRYNQNGQVDGINRPNGDVMPVNGDGRSQYMSDSANLYNRSKNDMMQIGSYNLANQIAMERVRTDNSIRQSNEIAVGAERAKDSLAAYNQRQHEAAMSSRNANAQYHAAAEAAEAQKEAARQNARASAESSRAGLMGSIFSSAMSAGNAQGWRYW